MICHEKKILTHHHKSHFWQIHSAKTTERHHQYHYSSMPWQCVNMQHVIILMHWQITGTQLFVNVINGQIACDYRTNHRKTVYNIVDRSRSNCFLGPHQWQVQHDALLYNYVLSAIALIYSFSDSLILLLQNKASIFTLCFKNRLNTQMILPQQIQGDSMTSRNSLAAGNGRPKNTESLSPCKYMAQGAGMWNRQQQCRSEATTQRSV